MAKFLAVRMRDVGDVVVDFGLSAAGTAGDAAKFNAAALDRSNNRPITMPGGKHEQDATWNMPFRSSATLLGAGYAGAVTDDFYTGSADQAYGGTPSRLVWNGADAGTQIFDPGVQHSYGNFHLQSRPIRGDNFGESFLSDATNATPIVVTTETFPHGLTDGDPIHIRNVTGNTAANGDYYADVLTTTTVALYSDAGLTTPVAGNGAYTNAAKTADWWGPRSRIGIHISTQEGSPSGVVPCGKHVLRDLSFHNVPICILFGYDLVDAYAMESSYVGSDYNHADETVGDNLRFYYPYYVDETVERTFIYFRNNQSVGHHFGKISANGAPNEVFYVERGGVLKVENLTLNGNAPRGIVRIGNLSNLDVRVEHFNVDSGDPIGRHTMLLNMDQHGIGAYVRMAGNHRGAWNHATSPVDLPLVVARGTCKVDLAVNGLVPGSIRMIGQTFGASPTNNRLAWVHLCKGTKIYGTNDPADLIAASGNVAPFLLTWDDIEAYFFNNGAGQIFENQPIAAGQYTAQLGNVTFGP